MRVRWSTEAAEDLERIHRRIARDNPAAAHRTVQKLYAGCMALKKFPYRCRAGREPGTRELVFRPLPYIAVYRVTETHVEIARIWHSAQDWP